MSKYDQLLNAAQRPTGTLEVTPDESEAEASARLERFRARQLHQLWRERVILTAVTAGLSILFLFSLVTISLPQATTEAKEVAKQALRRPSSSVTSWDGGAETEL